MNTYSKDVNVEKYHDVNNTPVSIDYEADDASETDYYKTLFPDPNGAGGEMPE